MIEDQSTKVNEEATGFFCGACLVDVDQNLMSPDLRYCQGCYDLLLKEAASLSGNKRPKWIPRAGKAADNATPGAGGHPISILSRCSKLNKAGQ